MSIPGEHDAAPSSSEPSSSATAALPFVISRSFALGKVAQVEIRLSITILLLFAALIVLATIDTLRYPNDTFLDHFALVVLVTCLFLCMALHEAGHAAAARLRGHRPRTIILSFVGLTVFERTHITPSDEFLIGFAGPLVNACLAVLFFLLIPDSDTAWRHFGPVPVYHYTTWAGLTSWLCIANAAVATFNLLPLYPLDGSRVLLGILSSFVERRRALLIVIGTSLILGFATVAYIVVDLIVLDNDLHFLHFALMLIAWITIVGSLRMLKHRDGVRQLSS